MTGTEEYPDAGYAGAGYADAALRDRLVSLTRDLILIPSAAAHPAEIERGLDLLRIQLDTVAGLRLEEHRCAGVPSLVVRPAAVVRPEVLLLAHVDVVDHGPFGLYRSQVRDGRIYGPGAGDMKGALAVLVTLFTELHHRHPGISLGLAVTGDEEHGGRNGAGHLAEQGLTCGVALLPDGGSIDAVVVAEKGILHLDAEWRGVSTHAAYPWEGRNPVTAMLSDLTRLQERFAALAAEAQAGSGRAGGDSEAPAAAAAGEHWHPTATVTTLESESHTLNRIPAYARAGIDVRFTPPWTVAGMLAEVRACLSGSTRVTPRVGDEPTEMTPNPEFMAIGERVLGRPMWVVRTAGTSDARFLSQRGIPVIISRPLVGNVHRPDEWIDIASMLQYYRMLLAFISDRLGLAAADAGAAPGAAGQPARRPPGARPA